MNLPLLRWLMAIGLSSTMLVSCQSSPGADLARPTEAVAVTSHDLPFVVLAPEDIEGYGPMVAAPGTGRVNNEQLSDLTLSPLDTAETWDSLARVDGFESTFARSDAATEELARVVAHLFADGASATRGQARLVQDARAASQRIPTGATTDVEERSVEIGAHVATVINVTTAGGDGRGERRATALLQRDSVLLEAHASGSAAANPEELAVMLVERMSAHVDGIVAADVTWKPIASQPPRGYTPPPGPPIPVDFTSMMLGPEDIVGPTVEVHSESCVPTAGGARHTRAFTARTPRFVLDGYDIEWLRITTELYETPEAARLAIQPLTSGMTHDAFMSRIEDLDGAPLVESGDLLGTSFHSRDIGDGSASYKARISEDTTYSFFAARVGSVIVTVSALGHEAADDSSEVLLPVGRLAVQRVADAAASGSFVVPPS